MRQLTLQLGSDPIATLAGYLGGAHAMLEEAARSFLCDGRVTYFPIDMPRDVLTEAAAQIWTAEELAELRELQTALECAKGTETFMLAWRAESLCCAKLIRRVSPRWAAYWERGWRSNADI